MPTRERRRAEQKRHKARIWGALAAILTALVPAIVPRFPSWIVVVLVVIWVCSWSMARYGYVYNLALKWSLLLFLLHAAILIVLGYWVWPSIGVSPHQALFRGYAGETYNFSVTNGRGDDVYDVQIPIDLNRGRHLDDKFSARVTPNSDPPQPMHDDYSYCYGEKGPVATVKPNEREALIIKLTHLAPQETRSFSVTYAGGGNVQASVERPTFLSTPYSYSPSQGTMDVRGDYRICKFVLSPNQPKAS